MKQKTAKKVVGDKGEDIACEFLMKHQFSIVERNYLKKCGEIDIVAKRKGIFRFIEVKTVSRERVLGVKNDNYRPEDNISKSKLKRLSRVIQTYLLEVAGNGSEPNLIEWKFDLVTVQLDQKSRRAHVSFFGDLLLPN